MNIILLILGAFLIIFSIVKITIGLNNKEIETISETKEEKQVEPNIKLNVEPTNIEEEKLDYNEERSETNIIGETIDTTIANEEENLFKDLEDAENLNFEEEYIDVITTENNRPNMTNEIINMYEKGLTVKEIAKRLKKGIREIEIILKINKIIE